MTMRLFSLKLHADDIFLVSNRTLLYYDLLLAGIKNIRTKSLGSNNKQNVVLATIEGLRQIKTPEEVAKLRGKSVEEIFG